MPIIEFTTFVREKGEKSETGEKRNDDRGQKTEDRGKIVDYRCEKA
jgi:hypothetical protein